MKQKLILLALVMGLTIVSQSSLSLGMGKIQVYSALNEPLQSSIDLLANTDEELLNLEVKLASSEDYQKVGLDKSFVPGNIVVAFDEENPLQINVTSNGPVSEPIVSLLLDVNWSNGRILREFTVLLDPPVYESVNTQVSSVVVEPMQNNTVTEAVEEPVISDTEPQLQERESTTTTITNADFADDTTGTETAVEETVDPPTYSSNSAAEVYVEAGDTLWRIANNNKVGDLSAQQMMMAIYNKNPNAFIDNNINKMIKGSRLDMPSLDEANSIGFSEAMAQVESHHQSWTPAQQDYNTFQTTETTAEQSDESTSSLDYGVQLSGGDNEGSDGGQSNADEGTSAENVQAIEEDLYNQTAENTDLKERISELEDIVEQQQDAIEIGDDSLANLENQLGNEAEELVDDAEAAVDDVWDEASQSVDDAVTAVEDELSLNVSTVDVVTSEDGLQVGAFDATDDESVEDAAEGDNAEAEQPAEADQPAAPEKFTPAKQESSFVDNSINWVMDNLMWVLIGLVVLIVLLFLPKLLSGGDDDEDDETSFLDDIKNRKRESANDDIDEVETKMNKPLVDDEVDEVEDSGDDVLAELDRSIDFEDDEEVALVTDEVVEDEVTELSEDGEFETVEDDGFDLDGFLNDDDNDDSTETKDHAATLAGVSFDEDASDTSNELVDESATDDDMSFDDMDLNLDDDLDELADDVVDSVDEISDDIEEVVEEAAEVATDAVEESKDEVDDFSFDDDEDFDFDLDEELEELEQAEDIEAVDGDDDTADEEFNDMLDISDDASETFEIIEEESNMDEEIDLGLEDLMDDTDAIDTKLDLAKAYIDMGDSEGAKNLLDEIYAEGTEEQIAAAKKLLDDM